MLAVRKAAILLLSLGRQAAESVLLCMKPQQAEQVLASIEHATDASLEEVNQVLSEFYQQRINQMGGIEALGHIAVEDAVNLLKQEHPQVAAIALMQIKPRANAIAVLVALPTSLQQELILRLALTKHVSATVIKDVNNTIQGSIKLPSLPPSLEFLQYLLQQVKPQLANKLLRKVHKHPVASRQINLLQ